MRGALSLKPSYYDALKRLTLELSGVNLGADHAFLVETRLAGLAGREGYPTLNAMIEELFSTGQTRLAVQVVSTLVERDTHFNRDPESFDRLTDHVIPSLHQARKGGRIRILSFGCSSGQEPYGIAMKINKNRAQFEDIKIDIVGVDYPSQALERAKAGRYTHFEVQRGLPVRDLIESFDRDGEDWVVKKSLRQQVEFKDVHLLSNLDTLGTFHAVLFRGNLPRLSPPAQVRVLRGLSHMVTPFGFLLLGSGESLADMNYGFDKVRGQAGLFRRREVLPEEPPEDPNIKKPSDRTTFERTKRKHRAMGG